MRQYHSTPISFSHDPSHHTNLAQNLFRNIWRSCTHSSTPSISELFTQAEAATTVYDLTEAVNSLQENLWELPVREQLLLRRRLTAALSTHVLHAPDRILRLEAASWLRTLMQAGFIPQPEEVFVTLVTAATQAARRSGQDSFYELEQYLKMISDCFWPFRDPYPVFTWESLSANEVFYPLVSLFCNAGVNIEEWLSLIFTEIPSLGGISHLSKKYRCL